MWTCPKCGEQIEDQFDSCWKCAAGADQTAPGPAAPWRWGKAFLCGFLFECILFMLLLLLPGTRAFFLWIHFPALWFANFLHLDLLSLLLVPLLMALGWAVLFRCGWGLVVSVGARMILSRRQRLLVACGIGFLSVVGLATAIIAAWPESSTPFTSSPQIKSVVEGNTAFALDLYQKRKEQPGNLFFSPYSISTALAMTYAGARGQTESEMAATLHFNLPQDDLHVAFGQLITRMEKVRRWNRITLATANSLWCQKDYPFTGSFLNLVRTRYQAEARPENFKSDAPAARNEINAWVEKKTKGRIQAMIEPGQLTQDTRLILCNAIYFKGKWRNQFRPKDTVPGPFYMTQSNIVTVPMMSQKAQVKAVELEDSPVSIAELPYSGLDLSMIILLPGSQRGSSRLERIDLSDLERDLTAENLRAWLAELDRSSQHETHIELPRFTITQGFELTKVLAALGMPSAFGAGADFSGMEGSTNLFVSDVVHKAFVEVNEAGTEAAAATWVLGKPKGMANRFVADHPFLFLIRENGSGSILFLGRVVDPSK